MKNKTSTPSVPVHRPQSLSRRLFLGGAGAAVALPFLRSALPTSAARADEGACTPPKRMIAYYVPCGIHMANWTPSTEGSGFALPPILAPLEEVREHVNVITGLSNQPAFPDGPGDHASGTGAFITAAHPYKTEGSDIRNGISMDQVAAQSIGACTRIGSLQLGIDGGSSAGGCDSGYSCAYARNISWADERTPLAKVTNPEVVFDTMFSGFDPAATTEQLAKRRLYKTSVLDYVLADAQRLDMKLSTTDRAKLDQYLTAVREIETRIEASSTGPSCGVPDRPSSDLDFQAHVQMMADLMILAFQCDLTRVISFMLGNAGSGRVYSFLGISEGHHEISHHDGIEENFRKLTIIDTWEVQQLAHLVRRLRDTPDVTGTLLDNTAVFFSSEIEDGNSHSHHNMPIVVAGTCGGAFATGRHLRYADRPSVANLFLAILHAVGAPVASFGNSTGVLPSLSG